MEFLINFLTGLLFIGILAALLAGMFLLGKVFGILGFLAIPVLVGAWVIGTLLNY